MATENIVQDWTTLSYNATPTFYPTGPFRLLDPENDTGRAWLDVASISGTNPSVASAVQVSNSTTDTSAATVTSLMTAATTTGVTNPTTPQAISGITTAKYIRDGIYASTSTGTGTARLSGVQQIYPG